MAAEHSSDAKFEIGHVLFIDLVGYSKLLLDEQKERLRELIDVVLGTAQVRAAPNEELVRLPTGDGMALVFRNSSEEPAQCALEIARALKEHSEIQVRMGIHSGPVSEVSDVSGRSNIAGPGINLAQRVMDCGDAGHILLSQRVADDLAQYRQWSTQLHDLGECEVKHQVRLHLFNLHTEEAGNPAVPEKLRKRRKNKPSPAAARRRGARPPVRRSRLPAVLGGGAVLAVVLLVWWLIRPHNSTESSRSAVTTSPKPAASIPAKSIAVLPFENLSSNKENAYFADGIQDEILTKLAGLADLKVISRTSTAKYQSKPDDLKTVSQQLGVANVVEGTVQRAAEKLRVNVQLIDARAESHLWAKSFDGDAKDVFAIESKISQEIADALQAKLSPNETHTLAATPTQDAEAYDLFLKGEYEEREADGSLKPESFDRAASFYQQALDRDPKFALAAARLVESRMDRHWFVKKLSEAELNRVKSIAENALVLAPDLAAAHIALASFYYLGYRNYDQALQELQRALDLEPNNLRALEFSAYVHRRQGQWQQALTELTKCEDRDPRDASLVANIAAIYCNLRLWPEAIRLGSRALALDPHNVLGMREVVTSYLNGTGNVTEAKRALATFPPDVRLINKVVIANAQGVISEAAYLHIMERDFAGALKDWEIERVDPDENRMRPAARAAIHVLVGDAAGARDEIEKARALFEARLHERPQDGSAMMQLAWINLALKHNAEALNLAQRASESLPVEKDSVGGPFFLSGLAEVEAQVGETSEAVKNLRYLLTIPAGIFVSIERLKIDPVWDPIRNDPGFQQLLTGTQLIGPPK